MSLNVIVDALHSRTTWTVSSVATLALASLAGLGIAYVMPGGAAAASGTEATVGATARPAGQPVWTIADDLGRATCAARRGPRLSGATHALHLGEGCVAVSERLAEAVVWNESRDGTVTLSDAGGRLVVAFAPSEGPALEAFRPAHMMLSLARD